MTPIQIAIAAAAALFLLYVLVQVRPLASGAGRHASKEMSAAKKRAHEAKSPEERAAALTDAAVAAVRVGRSRAAAGLFLRALRASPERVETVGAMVGALRSRPALLESLLLRRVAMAPAEPSGADPALEAALHGLADLYDGRRERGRARLVRRLIARELGAAEK
jgi:hypothetical protein